MRKLIAVILTLLLVGILYGCSGGTKEATEPVQEVPDLVIETEEETVPKTSDAIPDPEEFFSEGTHVAILVYNKPHSYYQVTDYQDGEYEAYVNACVEAGFTDIQYKGGTDGNEMFLAYDENHEFYLDVGITPETGIISITVDLVEEE